MHPHFSASMAGTLTDRSVLDHRLVESEEECVLMVRTRPHDARKLRKRIETQLSEFGTRTTVVLNSSTRQDVDTSRWSHAEPPLPAGTPPLRLGSYLLA
jgi:hypothetical protein